LTSRGAATRKRILDVATQEFAEHGIAGARVERVVVARAPTRRSHSYSGNPVLGELLVATSRMRLRVRGATRGQRLIGHAGQTTNRTVGLL